MAVMLRRPLAVLLLGLVFTALALFEDEVGQYEWILQQIGQPTALAYTAEASNTVFTASAGVVASVLLKDGSIQWRRISANNGRISILRAGPRGVVSVTDRGFVQAWKGSSGDLVWQREYPEPVIELLIGGLDPKSQSVVVVRHSEVEVRAMAGKHEWSVPAGTGTARFWAASLSGDGTSICALATGREGNAATSLLINIATGTVQGQSDVEENVAHGLQHGTHIIVGEQLVFLSGGVLASHPLCGGGASATFDLGTLSTESGSFRLMPSQTTPGVFAVTNGVTTVVFGVGSKGLKMLRTFEGVAVVGPVHSVHDDEGGQPVAVAIMRDEGAQIQLLDPASGNVQPAIQAVDYKATDHGHAQLMLVKELSSGEHRTILVAADHSIAALHGSKVMWIREEALAAIRQASFYGRSALAASHTASRSPRSEAVDFHSAVTALSAQLSELPRLIQDLVDVPAQLFADANDRIQTMLGEQRPKKVEKANLLASARVPSSASELRSFGASKLLLAITRANKIFALEATTSEIVWQRYFESGIEEDCTSGAIPNGTAPGSGEGQSCGVWAQLLPSSSASHSELLVVTAGAAQVLVWLDPLTGNELHREAAPVGASIVTIMPLPVPHAEHKAILPVLIVDSLRRVHSMPASFPAAEGVADLFEASADRLFHYEVDREAQAVQGFALGQGKSGSTLLNLWNLDLALVGERIVAATSLAHREWEHVPVHIKGDASILYKYINANLLTVATQDTVGKGNVSSLTLYTLDGVTGHVLHQTRIVGGSGPVHLASCDNWVLIHYWNVKKARFEITVVDFFEAKPDDGPWNILFGVGGQDNSSKSAHHLEPPVPLQQTYIFPAGVTSMGVTATLKGITPRSLIMALSTDQVLRVSKDLLNPRRPYPASAGSDKMKLPAQFAPTKEEAVPLYSPLIALKPTDVLNYYNPVGSVSGIISTPTALESTSLIFCYGLDLFFSPVRTASAYDVLSPGFNYTLLYASVALVVTLCGATWYYAQRKALQDRWR